MSERPKPRARRIIQILASLGAGLIPGLLEWSLGTDPHDVFLDCVIGAVYSCAISALAWSILPVAMPRLFRLKPLVRWTAIILLITAIAMTGSFLALCMLTAFHVTPATAFWHIYANSTRVAIVISLVFSLGATFQRILTSKLNRVTEELKARDLAEERLRQAATEARLSSLESRIHPHFLFNTLNSITALIRENPVEAERMVERLAALLRFSLDSSGNRLVPLSQELSIVRSYLEIEKVRFGSRLSYRIEADPTLNSLEVPPLSVQTLVENSVKFAVSPRREGAEIVVRAEWRAGKPAIDVIDNGAGFSLSDLKPGHGLDILQSRLSAQFGSAAALEIGREPRLTRVSVLL